MFYQQTQHPETKAYLVFSMYKGQRKNCGISDPLQKTLDNLLYRNKPIVFSCSTVGPIVNINNPKRKDFVPFLSKLNSTSDILGKHTFHEMRAANEKKYRALVCSSIAE